MRPEPVIRTCDSSSALWFPAILFTCLVIGFAAYLSASEPTLSENAAAAPPAAPTNAAASLPAAQPEHPFTEPDLLELLTTTLQQEYVKDKGELELHFSQSWKTRNVPAEPLSLKILDLPTLGVIPLFIVRFELHTPSRTLVTGQMPLQARVWREVWVARSALQRGDPVADADLARERRDVLTLHEPPAEFAPGDSTLELAEPLPTGAVLCARAVKARPVIHRGESAEALVQDGALNITLKVEALEDGAPGQLIRVRNAQSRRDIRGKVINGQTILVSL